MINDLGDLKKLLRLCRQQGVTEIKLGTVELKLGDLPQDTSKEEILADPDDKFANFPQGDLSAEQLMFYSSGGLPEDDPFKAEQ